MITKSSIESANTIASLAMTAGEQRQQHAVEHLARRAPRSAAASSYSGPIETRRPRTITTTYESVNVIWPIACAAVPRPIAVNGRKSWRNSRSRDTPITISGVTSGSSIMMLTVPEPRPRQRCRPIASVTPSGVATSTEMIASIEGVLERRLQVGVVQHRVALSPVNQRSENPCQVVRDRPALNANRIATATGRIDQAM